MGYFLCVFLADLTVFEAGVVIYAVESRYVVPPLSMKVSESHTRILFVFLSDNFSRGFLQAV